MVKIGAIVIANRDRENIWYCLRGIYDFCDKVVVIYSDTTWTGKTKSDGTLEVLKTFRDPDNKLNIIEGTFSGQHDQRNVGLKILKAENYDYVFVVDSDEIYDPSTLVNARTIINQRPDADMFRVKFKELWKTFEYVIVPERHITVFYKMRPEFYWVGPARQSSYRGLNELITVVLPIECYHLMCVCSDEYMKEKINTRMYRHKVMPNWYEEVWLKWQPEMKNLHSTSPKVFRQAVQFNKTQLPDFMKTHRFWKKDV